MTGRALILASLLATASACAARGKPQPMPEARGANWKTMATAKDMGRITGWRTAFVAALTDARKNGNAAAVAREGALLDPDAALHDPALPAGNYRCRTIKLGSKQPGLLSYVAYPPFGCRVTEEGEVMGFRKTSGSQRPVGLIFPGDGPRRIFLGTLVLGDETRALEYGQDPMRDMAGAIERIGPNRWRLILPYPNYESIMDVIELLPAS